jgi:hypothetical protein
VAAEGAIAVPHQDGQRVGQPVGDDEIRRCIEIQIRNGHTAGVGAHLVVRRRSERSGLVQEDCGRAGRLHADSDARNDVEQAVTIDVGQRDGRGSAGDRVVRGRAEEGRTRLAEQHADGMRAELEVGHDGVGDRVLVHEADGQSHRLAGRVVDRRSQRAAPRIEKNAERAYPAWTTTTSR